MSKKILIGIAVFIIGFFFGSANAPKETEVKNKADWIGLKRVDDQLIDSCGQNFSIVSDIFEAQAKLDFETAKNKTKDLDDGAVVVKDLSDQRLKALSKLGY